jgi:hypothetical protein
MLLVTDVSCCVWSLQPCTLHSQFCWVPTLTSEPLPNIGYLLMHKYAGSTQPCVQLLLLAYSLALRSYENLGILYHRCPFFQPASTEVFLSLNFYFRGEVVSLTLNLLPRGTRDYLSSCLISTAVPLNFPLYNIKCVHRIKIIANTRY